MADSLTRIWLHGIWSTKNHEPLITQKFEFELHNQIRKKLTELGCKVLRINGISNHVHCLFSLPSTKAISFVIGQAKGSSAHFVNHSGLTEVPFEWQDGYGAFSVSENNLSVVTKYLENHKVHHSQKTYRQELEDLGLVGRGR